MALLTANVCKAQRPLPSNLVPIDLALLETMVSVLEAGQRCLEDGCMWILGEDTILQEMYTSLGQALKYFCLSSPAPRMRDNGCNQP